MYGHIFEDDMDELADALDAVSARVGSSTPVTMIAASGMGREVRDEGDRATDAHVDGIDAQAFRKEARGLVVDGPLGHRREARPGLLEL